jgi:hypothetical protein
MISVSSSGSFKNVEAFLRRASRVDIKSILDSCGKEGVRALEQATPVESGLAARSWYYTTSVRNGVYRISWNNSDVESGFPVAIMLQYGYATGTGGYVQGVDYINPAMKPIFDKIASKVWKAVTG